MRAFGGETAFSACDQSPPTRVPAFLPDMPPRGAVVSCVGGVARVQLRARLLRRLLRLSHSLVIQTQ